MPRRSRKQAVQVNMDSDEEFTISSEEDEDFEDERLHFEDRIDPVVDTNEWVIFPPHIAVSTSLHYQWNVLARVAGNFSKCLLIQRNVAYTLVLYGLK